VTKVATISRICPLLPAADTAATALWYADKLGFSVKLDMRDYAILERDGAEVHLWKSDDRSLAENTAIYLRSEDVDALHATFAGAAEGGRIAPPQDCDWGMREFYIWDPNGNLLKFGQPVAGGGVN
jgi:uncharacterized glyoxalase superfamily protein PhnB